MSMKIVLININLLVKWNDISVNDDLHFNKKFNDEFHFNEKFNDDLWYIEWYKLLRIICDI